VVVITIPGSNVQLPARAEVTQPTRSVQAWRGIYLTVELYRPVEAMRVAAKPLGLVGDWFALGDWIQPRSRYRELHALPTAFAFQALATLRPGTVLNVGLCAPLFRQPGGGLQAEFLDGPLPQIRPIQGTWVDQMGHA
jgi:hypothetical protein